MRTCVAMLTAVVASCASPDDRAHDPERAFARDHARASAALDGARPSSLADAARYSVETVVFELPLPMAEELYGRAAGEDSTLGTPIDEARCREALEILAPSNPAIVRSERPRVVVGLAELAHVPPRNPSQAAPARSLAGDFLELDVRVLRGRGWTPIDLELRIRWSDPEGRVLGRLPGSTSPLPGGASMQIVCLPSRSDFEKRKTPALFAFVRVVPSD